MDGAAGMHNCMGPQEWCFMHFGDIYCRVFAPRGVFLRDDCVLWRLSEKKRFEKLVLGDVVCISA